MKCLFLLLGDCEYFENMSRKCSSLKACHWLVKHSVHGDTWGWHEWQVGTAMQIYHWPDVPLERKTISRLSDNYNIPCGRKINLPESTFRHLKNSYGKKERKKNPQGCLTLNILLFMVWLADLPRNICAFLRIFCSCVLIHFKIQTCLFREII